MADAKISDLAALSSLAVGDLLEIVDVSDTSMDASGANKKVTLETLRAFMGSYVLGQSAVSVAIPNNTLTTEQTFATVTVPANALGANGRLRVTSLWSYTNSGNNKTLRVRFGGAAGTIYTSLTVTTTLTTRVMTEVASRNATNVQVGGPAGLGGGWGTAGVAVVTSALDTTAAQDIVFRGTLASAGEAITLESYLVELIP